MMGEQRSHPIFVCSLRLDLRSGGETSFVYFPATSLHAALHRGIETIDPAHARWMHDAPNKPFALSPLYRSATGEPVAGGVAAGERVHAWLTILETNSLAAMLTFLGARPTLYLERVAYTVESVAPSAPSASTVPPLTTYPGLRAAAAPAPEISLRFLSPTVFRNQGRDLVQPDPRLVFHGFLRRWHAFSDAPLSGVSKDSLGAGVHLQAAQSEHVRVALGRSEHSAFIGQASYFIGGDETFQKGIVALADYAAYCGTGARTALGLGQVVLDAGSQLPPIRGIAHKHPVSTHDPAFHLIEPHLAPELDWLVCPASSNNRRVRLEQAHDLLGG